MSDPDPDPDPDTHSDSRREYELLSGELTRTRDDGTVEKFVEGDIFVPTAAELDSFGDRLTLAGNGSDESARETGHPMVVTGRSYRLMSNYDGRELRPQSRTSRSRSDRSNREITDHPQAEDQQNLPEPDDPITKNREGMERLFHPPKRSPLSSGTALRKAAEANTDDTSAINTSDSRGRNRDQNGVSDVVGRIESLAADYASDDVEMTHAEYEDRLDDILASVDVSTAIDALEQTNISGPGSGAGR